MTAEYRESLHLGYRYFDSAGEEVEFPFGHGLSYTSFAWSDVAVAVSPSGDDVTVNLSVTNTGSRVGSEVVQVYVHDVESSVFRPEQELRGFAKVALEPGASEAVSIRLPQRAFSFWDVDSRSWVLESGRFEIRVARSSRDVVWRGDVDLSGQAAPHERDEPSAYRAPSGNSDSRSPISSVCSDIRCHRTSPLDRGGSLSTPPSVTCSRPGRDGFFGAFWRVRP